MTPEAALDALRAMAEPGRAAQMREYHKVERDYIGVPMPPLNDLAQSLRRELDLQARVDLARALWARDIFESRVLAAKLLTQARIRNDAPVWQTFLDWVPDFDSWAIADHACEAGRRRLLADPARLDNVANWPLSEHMWTRRAALVATLPWARMPHPSEADLAVRERVLSWAALLATDRDWFIQKAIGWWLRDLSRHDAARTARFVAEHGAALKPFARREALRHVAGRQRG